jgi:peptidoglycan/LPS O-acetylase OafA/YrhL
MLRTIGITCIVLGYAGALALALARRRRSERASPGWIALVFAAGVVLGLGATMLHADPSPMTWLAAPALVGVGTVMHVAALMQGTGPMRT